MTKLTIVKFGGSAIGPFGRSIPQIIHRIQDLKRDAKVIAVFSAPLTIQKDETYSLTDIVLKQGQSAEEGIVPTLDVVKNTYKEITKMVNEEHTSACNDTISAHLKYAQTALDAAYEKSEFADETRSKALGFTGEILMSHVMNYILCSNGIKSTTVKYEDWPIITDKNIEFTNFMVSESRVRMSKLADLVSQNDVVTIGGFIGKTVDGVVTTYERGGSDRTAADLGILFHKEYDTRIDFEKDSSVVSADPKIVHDHLSDVDQLSYNEARLAGMFGMKILDPITIKEILENGVDVPITITNMNDPTKVTTIKRLLTENKGHPIKIVTGRENCAILRIETSLVDKLLTSLDQERRYNEFVTLSPFTRDGIAFSRILFLDGDYVKRNEKYLLGFDSLATITYNRGVITLIGDEMWRVQQVASRTSAKIGDAGLNILNMDAQEETSRIIIIVEDSTDNIKRAIASIHQEISEIKFI